jgi:DNA-directed RNA polymerase specialized sigma24 family protein
MREAQTDPTLIAGELAHGAEFLRALPVQFRQVFTLRRVYGYPQKEIACRPGIPEHAVEEHFAQAASHVAHAALDSAAMGRCPSPFDRLR